MIAWAKIHSKGQSKVDRPHASHVAACDAKEHEPFYGRVLRRTQMTLLCIYVKSRGMRAQRKYVYIHICLFGFLGKLVT